MVPLLRGGDWLVPPPFQGGVRGGPVLFSRLNAIEPFRPCGPHAQWAACAPPWRANLCITTFQVVIASGSEAIQMFAIQGQGETGHSVSIRCNGNVSALRLPGKGWIALLAWAAKLDRSHVEGPCGSWPSPLSLSILRQSE